jgi:4-hydroxy-4-methyl-2-oxoglutarate aldolase
LNTRKTLCNIDQSTEPIANELIRQFHDLSSAKVCESYNGKGVLSPKIKPISSHMKMCGTALTVKLPLGDNLMLHKAIYVAQPGDVIVADSDGYLGAGA